MILEIVVTESDLSDGFLVLNESQNKLICRGKVSSINWWKLDQIVTSQGIIFPFVLVTKPAS